MSYSYETAEAKPEFPIVALAHEYAEISRNIGRLQEQMRQANMELKKLIEAQQEIKRQISSIIDPAEEAPRRA